MRKFGSTKRNPNPPWPGVQQGVVLPPGSGISMVSGTNEKVGNSENSKADSSQSAFVGVKNNEPQSIHTRDGFLPIMGHMNEAGTVAMQPNRECTNMNVSDYLCDKVGNYARVEFLFGENSHIEKIGIIDSVGKDFLVLNEAGTGSHIVCSSKNIKFINIYNLK